MATNPTNNQARRLALLISGLIDMLLGAGLVLATTGIFPVNLPLFGIPGWVTDAIGFVLFLSGLAFVAYQLTRPRLPD